MESEDSIRQIALTVIGSPYHDAVAVAFRLRGGSDAPGVLVGMLREDESREQPWPFEAVLHYEGECPGVPRAPRGAGLNLACGM